MISTVDGVRGMTGRNRPAWRVTAWIQVRMLDDEQRRFGRGPRRRVDSAVNRRRRASGSSGAGHGGVGNAEQIIGSSRSCGSAWGTMPAAFARRLRRRGRPPCPRAAAAPPPGRECRWRGFAEGPVHLVSATGRQRRGLPRHPGLAMPGGPTTLTTGTAATDHVVHDRRRGRPSPSADRPGSPRRARPAQRAGRSPAAGARAPFIGPLMRSHSGSASIKVCSTSRAMDSDSIAPPGERPIHPLRQPNLLADRSVPQRPRTDVTGDHLTRVQALAHLEVHTVALSDFDGKPLRLLLNAHGRQAGANGVGPRRPVRAPKSPSPRRR